MKTLAYLNTVGATTYSYTEQRTPNVIFDRREPKNTTFILEYNTFSVPAAINIIQIILPATTDIKYILEVPSFPSGISVDFGTRPSGVSLTQVGNTYTVSGIDSVSDWEAIKNPTVTLPVGYEGDVVCNVSIQYTTAQGVQTKSWVVGTFIPFSRMVAEATLTCDLVPSTAAIGILKSGFYMISDFEYTGISTAPRVDWLASTTTNFSGPQITENIEDTWTVEVEANNPAYISTISENGVANSSFDSVNKILTITGTRAAVNDSLQNLSFTPAGTKIDFTFEYLAYRAGAPLVEYTRSQEARCMNLQYLTDARGPAEYLPSIATTIGTSLPTVYDPDYTDPKGIYLIAVTTSTPDLVSSIGLGSSRLTRWATQPIKTSTDTGDFSKSAAFGSTNNIIAIGEPFDDLASPNAGRIHIYEKQSGVWTEIGDVVGLNTGQTEIGSRLIMTDDDTIITSGYLYNTSTINDPKGRVLVYERNPLGWELAQTIVPPLDVDDAFFGFQISATRNGDILAISELNNSSNNRYGRVHIYTRTGLGDYSLSATITDPNLEDTDDFGYAQCKLNPSGNRLVVSRGLSYPGDTYFYTNVGGTWTLEETLVNELRQIEWIDDDTYIWHDTSSFYVYQRQAGGNYTQQASFTPSKTLIFTTTSQGFRINAAKNTIVVRDSSRRDFIFIDFDSTTNTFNELRILPSSAGIGAVSDDGLEVILIDVYGWSTLSYSTKTNDLLFDETTKTLSFYNTKTEVQNDIDTITVTSSYGVVSNIVLSVSVDTPEGNTQTKSLTVTYKD